MAEYYDRQGQPMDQGAWLEKFGDEGYKRVAMTDVPEGSVSTVWLGLDHQFGDGPPHIFESMFFARGEHDDDNDCDRYSTEAEALAGHERMVARYSAPKITTEKP